MTRREVDHLIVGAGLAGVEAAAGIRELDAGAPVVLLSAEADPPYDRPPLSKGLWTGAVTAIPFQQLPADVELHLGRGVVGLDPAARTVTDRLGDTWRYRRLLLATGGAPRRLTAPSERIIYFRTLADYRELRRLTGPGTRVVVVGGGFLGAELAAALTITDRCVVLATPELGLGTRVFPGDLARHLAGEFAERGAEIRTGTSVTRIHDEGNGVVVSTATGDVIRADVAVVAVGIQPGTTLASQGGLRVDDGIVVDHHMRTSLPDVFAAGDVARYPDAVFGLPARVEHEDHARLSGRLAGRNMAGAGEPYAHRPSFYGDLFEFGYEAVGTLDSRLATTADWQVPYREGVVYYLADGIIRGILLWNVWDRLDQARSLIGRSWRAGTPLPALAEQAHH